MPEKSIQMFNININAATLEEAADMVINASKKREKGLVVTPNVDHMVKLDKDSEFMKIYKNALFIFADGMPIVWLSKILPGMSLPERVTGADLLPKVCEKASNSGLKVMIIGGMIGVAEEASSKLKKKFNNLNIVGTYCPPMGFEKNHEETMRIIGFCNSRKPDIIFFGVGAPKQEKWASSNINQLNDCIILCVGAAIDFAAGNIQRAPKFIQNIGFEWFWRLIKDPRRLWKRYLIQDSWFILMTLRELTKQLIYLKKTSP
ncbi:MAG: WecB/TagA/CpsF family glycosyltransferase [Deltaproteobacteria bacterium]|nr:WecB/TagA/CpsF family glycosyltransferase [Deltaproteobacteria bacterium]